MCVSVRMNACVYLCLWDVCGYACMGVSVSACARCVYVVCLTVCHSVVVIVMRVCVVVYIATASGDDTRSFLVV